MLLAKKIFLYVMGSGYIVAGILHFINPRMYVKIIPPLLPSPLTLVYISGIAEILCGAGIMVPETRYFSAYALIALLIAVFPANIYMAMQPGKANIPQVYLYARLPLQLVLIWLAYIYTYD